MIDIVNFIVPFVFIVLGISLKYHKTPYDTHIRKRYKCSTQNGYNTKISRQSKEHWDYAQQIAPSIFIKIGLLLAVIECIVIQFSVSQMSGLIIGQIIGFIFIFIPFYYTDKCIKAHFND